MKSDYTHAESQLDHKSDTGLVWRETKQKSSGNDQIWYLPGITCTSIQLYIAKLWIGIATLSYRSDVRDYAHFCTIRDCFLGRHLRIVARCTLFLSTSRSCTPWSPLIPTLMSIHPPCVDTLTLLSVLQKGQGFDTPALRHSTDTQNRDKHAITLRQLRAASLLASRTLDYREEQEQLHKPHRDTWKNMQSLNRIKIEDMTFLVRGHCTRRHTTEQASKGKWVLRITMTPILSLSQSCSC